MNMWLQKILDIENNFLNDYKNRYNIFLKMEPCDERYEEEKLFLCRMTPNLCKCVMSPYKYSKKKIKKIYKQLNSRDIYPPVKKVKTPQEFWVLDTFCFNEDSMNKSPDAVATISLLWLMSSIIFLISAFTVSAIFSVLPFLVTIFLSLRSLCIYYSIEERNALIKILNHHEKHLSDYYDAEDSFFIDEDVNIPDFTSFLSKADDRILVSVDNEV